MTDESIPDSESVLAAFRTLDRPLATTQELAAVLDRDVEELDQDLDVLVDGGLLARKRVGDPSTLWYPAAWEDRLNPERVVVFPERRELVVAEPNQLTRAQLANLAHLVATSGDGSYLYRIRPVDVWHAPYETLDELTRTLRDVLPGPYPGLFDWIEAQWKRAHQFRLETHPDGYTVLTAGTATLMSNVAEQELTADHLRANISETEAWVAEGSEAAIKQRLFDAGFPVRDDRDLETGESLEFDLLVDLREYQHEWANAFIERGSGVLVGPPGSGKTIAAFGIMERIGGETLILVPSRELAGQWRDRILTDISLESDQVGEYHGGVKQRRPVTIATYHTASMQRHRSLFEERRWGLIIYDEVQHIPAAIHRRTADLQSRSRLGLSASPVRGDDKEDEIFTLIGPPIGTDWGALIEAGYVIEPELEIRYLPWGDETARDAYAAASGHRRRQEAAMNPAKIDDIERLRERHEGEALLVFADWLDQGEAIANTLGVPFVSGETPHSRREHLFEEFRTGRMDTLVVSRVGDEGIDLPDASVAILASGLGGSRRQGTQRVGRTMRPMGTAIVYVLATRATEEEDFARHQLKHLQGKGMTISETTVELESVAE